MFFIVLLASPQARRFESRQSFGYAEPRIEGRQMITVPQILVVEDNPQYRALLVARLEALGAATVDVADLDAAIEALERERFDLVLTDHQLPRGSGLDLLAYVARRFPELPRVLMSADVDAELRTRAALADAVHDKDELLNVLPLLVPRAAIAA
jgi:CheY-like chemotaxis protein